MAGKDKTNHRPLLDAVAFAARAHRGHKRKDGETPYVSHVFRVCLIVRHVFGIDDERVLAAALLHDTIEDTRTDYDDLAERFGDEIAGWVALLSKDKRQREAAREKAYVKQLLHGPWQVQACKLADIYDNLIDSTHLPPEAQQRSLNRARDYIAALSKKPPPEVSRPL